MTDYNSLVPAVANVAVVLSGNISSLVTRAKATGIVQRAQLQMLKGQTEKVIADARAHHIAEVVIENLEQLAKTQELIDNLEKQGRLHGKSLNMAMDQLEDLNNMLRRSLRKLEEGGLT